VSNGLGDSEDQKNEVNRTGTQHVDHGGTNDGERSGNRFLHSIPGGTLQRMQASLDALPENHPGPVQADANCEITAGSDQPVPLPQRSSSDCPNHHI